MTIIYVLVFASLILAGVALAGYTWAVRSGQFDDLETPRWKVLSDDAGPILVQDKDSKGRKA